MKRLSAFLATLIATIALWAYDFQLGDLCYTITSPNTVEVSRQAASDNDDNYYGLTTVTIPSTFTYEKTPYTVTAIGDKAFSKCYSLTTVNLPEELITIGTEAFAKCHKLQSIVIPDKVTTIGNRAFGNCDSLTSVVIGKRVQNMSFWGPDSPFSSGNIKSVVWNAVQCGGNGGGSGLDGVFVNSRNSIESFVFGDSVEHIPGDICKGMSLLKDIVLPESVKTIGKYAFYDCTGLESVNIPKNITYIGDIAFSGCSALKTLTWNARRGNFSLFHVDLGERSIKKLIIGKDVEFLPIDLNLDSVETFVWKVQRPDSINEDDRWGNFYAGVGKQVQNFIIDDNVTRLPERLGNSMYRLKSVVIPPNVKQVGAYIFGSCDSLTTIVWNAKQLDSDKITFFQSPFVESGKYISSFIFGDSVKVIPSYLCARLNRIQTIHIPDGVDSLGRGTFEKCDSLKTITGGKSLKSIGEWAFHMCTQLESIVLPDSLSVIGRDAFSDSGLSAITIPTGLDSIGRDAFEYCDKLHSVQWNATKCKTPRGETLFNNSAVTSFVFGDNVEIIPTGLCQGLRNLITITIPENVMCIEGQPFRYCDSLSTIIYNAKHCITEDDTNNSPFDISVNKKGNITSFIIGKTVEDIPNNLCYGMEGLTEISIPDNVKTIGDFAFGGCTALTSVTIPQNVDSMGKRVFFGCPITTVIWNARSCKADWSNGWECPFNEGYYSSVKEFTFGENVESIPNGLFQWWMSNLQSIYSLAIVPPLCSPNLFSSCYETPIYIPCGTKATYKEAQGWSRVTNIQEPAPDYAIILHSNDTLFGTAVVSETDCQLNTALVTAEPTHACRFTHWSDGSTENPRLIQLTQDTVFTAYFDIPVTSGKCGDNLTWSYDNNILTITGTGDMWDFNYDKEWSPIPWPTEVITSVQLPDGITSLGNSAFYGCTHLTQINMPNGITSIGDFAFASCSSLETISMHDNLSSIGVCAFRDCNSLTSVVIPRNVTIISSEAFARCTSLAFVTLHDDIKQIGGWAFNGCTNLTSVNFGKDITFIGDYAFYDCDKIETITFSDGNDSLIIGYQTFASCDSLNHIFLGNNVSTIGDYAFAWNDRLHSITCTAVTPPLCNAATFTSVDKSIPVYVPQASIAAYQMAEGWKDFTNYQTYSKPDTVSVEVVADKTSAIFAWPVTEDAHTYTLNIRQAGVNVRTLIFDAQGQLSVTKPYIYGTHAYTAVGDAEEYVYTIMDLDEATHYTYTLFVKNVQEIIIKNYQGGFDTEGVSTADNAPCATIDSNDSICKVLHDGQVYILRGDKMYTLTGVEVK